MLKKSKVAAVFAALALVVTTAPASSAATDKQLEIFTWWASGGEAAGLAGMTTQFEKLNPNTPFINASVAGGVSACPVRKSNSATCSQHSILKSVTSPSESDASE